MSRGLTSGMSTELVKAALSPVRFVEFEIHPPGSPSVDYARFWSGNYTINWDSKDWIGAGLFGSISTIKETRNLNAVSIVIQLSGIPISLIPDVLDDAKTGLPVRVWLGAIDTSDNIIADPYESFSGELDTKRITVGKDSATLTISCESDLIRLQIPNEIRMTQADQQARFPGDAGFDFVESLQDVQLVWGQASAPSAVPPATVAQPINYDL